MIQSCIAPFAGRAAGQEFDVLAHSQAHVIYPWVCLNVLHLHEVIAVFVDSQLLGGTVARLCEGSDRIKSIHQLAPFRTGSFRKIFMICLRSTRRTALAELTRTLRPETVSNIPPMQTWAVIIRAS